MSNILRVKKWQQRHVGRSLGVIFHILLTAQFPFSTSEDAIFKAVTWKLLRNETQLLSLSLMSNFNIFY